jgi:hypothetical protein
MDYKLALELKEAGFPQNFNLFERYYYEKEGKQLPKVKAPTLEQLIEAVGMPNVHGFISCSNKEWYAVIKTKNEYGIECEGRGSTPVGAVAKLWLALQKK